MIHNKPSTKGFTLMELLIVSGMFSILIIMIASIFVSALRIENNVFATKKVLSQISYSVEYMTRALRMAEKDTGQGCILRGNNYYILDGGKKIIFRNALQDDGDCQEFFMEDKQLKYKIHKGLPSEKTFELTSSDINISELKFTAHGQDQSDDFQPFVTIYIEAQSSDSPVLEIQTSVSQRNPDITR